MAHSGSKRKQEEAISALLSQPTIDKAALAAEISPRTLYRWLQNPEFKAEYRRVRQEAFSQTIARLQQGASAAATVLLKMMLKADTPASVRVRAAESILNHALKAAALETIESTSVESDEETRNPVEVPTALRGLPHTALP